ncbi:hypothetical protein [Luteolibacter soli]|uniref:Uncharacterized protein n=1 Tax=Luteolibacter soli TaxID=3135280 RepID=A0ABU9APN5_9BACT
MKPSLIPIACSTALTLMAGASAAHWCSVRDMVKLAGVMPMPAPQSPSIRPLPAPQDDSRTRQAEALLAEARSSGWKKPAADLPHAPAKTPSAATGATGATGDRFERLLSAMEGMVGENQRIQEENRQLRDNVADTNRSLMELQFRVDSYDGEFRPLKVQEEATPYDDGSAGVLPPLE